MNDNKFNEYPYNNYYLSFKGYAASGENCIPLFDYYFAVKFQTKKSPV